MGIEQSRRDDLESLGYLLVYLATGSLPWQGIKAKSKLDKYERIFDVKTNTVPQEICKFLPGMFGNLIKFIKWIYFKKHIFASLNYLNFETT